MKLKLTQVMDTVTGSVLDEVFTSPTAARNWLERTDTYGYQVIWASPYIFPAPRFAMNEHGDYSRI